MPTRFSWRRFAVADSSTARKSRCATRSGESCSARRATRVSGHLRLLRYQPKGLGPRQERRSGIPRRRVDCCWIMRVHRQLKIDAPPSAVWRCLVEPELQKQWITQLVDETPDD